MLPKELLAEVAEMLKPVKYVITAKADYKGKYLCLKLWHISPTKTFWTGTQPRRSSISLSLDPADLWEHNKKGAQMAIDALVRHIEKEDHE